MKQRICSMILVVTLFLSSIGLEGCGAESNTEAMRITQGEWITLINDAFGMYGYVEETPYYTNIKPGNPYFEQIQIAREWNVIDGSVSEFDLNAYVTYAFAAVTLINATGFVDEEVTAGKKVSIAQDWGFIITEEEYEIEDYISYNDAVVSLYFAKNQWADLNFDHVIEEVTFAEDVINYIEEDFVDYEISDGKTYIPAYAYSEMKAGDVYVLPANEDNLIASAFVVEEVYQEGDYYVIVNSANDEKLIEYVEELNIEETYTPNLMACNAYDADGNLIYSGSEYAYAQRMAAKEQYEGQKLGNYAGDIKYSNTDVEEEVSFSKEITDPKTKKRTIISGAFTKDGVKFSIEKEVGKSGNYIVGTGRNENAKDSIRLFAEAEVKNIEVTNDVDISWGKLKKARVSVDYEHSIEAGLKASSTIDLANFAPFNNRNGGFVSNFKNSVWKDASKGAESIKIVSFDLASAGIAKVTLGVYVYVEASGKISVKCTYESSKGIEYSDGKVRYINTDNETKEFIINASIEAGLKFELALVIGVFGHDAKLVAAELKLGIGIEAKLEVHFVDNENHLIESGSMEEIDIEIVEAFATKGATIDVEDMMDIAEKQGGVFEGNVVTEEIPLHIDNCLEVSVYVKASIGISSECLMSKFLKKSAEWKKEYKKDLFTAHVDNFSDLSFTGLLTGKVTTECTKKFTPFKALEETETSTEDILTYDFEEAGFLGISQYSIDLEAGETAHIKVSTLPGGYELKDVKFESNNEKIAMVSEDGSVLALDTGVTYIRVYIPDTQFEMRCAIIVGQEEVVPFEKLDDM